MPLDSSDPRVLDLTTNQRLKPHQAETRITAGVAKGVYEGTKLVAIQKLTIAEIIDIRSKQQASEQYLRTAPSKRGDYLPILEPDGHTWEPPQRERYCQASRWKLIGDARKFCGQVYGA